MLNIQVIGFIPPIAGVDNVFNTFRLGQALLKRVSEGDDVFLMDEKTKVVFGRAVVTQIVTGVLSDLCLNHAKSNHREVMNEPDGAPERLFKYIQKIYGPHIAVETKKSCVLYMKRIE